MDDPKTKKGDRDNTGTAGSPGVRVPAKGDSSASNVPYDPLQDATISDAPVEPPSPLPRSSKPSTRFVPPDATISESLADSLKSPANARQLAQRHLNEAVLEPGDVIGGRYEILQLLGEGGMGAVYKALDKEVERTVALKLIRPELASNPTILARFKQELLTAHQVTHKNVVRIYDIAEADGVKFITMEFVEGADLRRILLDNGKLAPEKAIDIIRQVCLALDAAHSAGIIHRDLKPQNIMQDSKTGRILVMDFGLARSIESEGMTQTGALLGTIEYMSPEQSMGKPLDQRSDIFALGLIFYELLTGNTPYKADTAMASLLRRNQERAIPAAEIDASIPKGLSDIVAKCLERDLEHRYQNVQQVLADLDNFQGARPTYASITLPPPVAPAKKPFPWKWVAVGALTVVALGGGWILRPGGGRTASTNNTTPKAPEVSLAILPFHNATTDVSLDWFGPSLAELLNTDVGQSASLRIVSLDRLHQILVDLRIPPNAELDQDTLRRVAEACNADLVVLGQYTKSGDQIRIDAKLQDLKQQRTIPLNVEPASASALVKTVNTLSHSIQQNLSLSSGALKQVQAAAFAPTSSSVEAIKDFTQGLELAREGNHIEAVKQFEAATQADPNFALAFSMLGQTYARLGYDRKAEEAGSRSVELSGNLSPAEKYMIQAVNARIGNNFQSALDAYNKLSDLMPNDPQIQFNLGELHEQHGEYDKAHDHYTRALQSDAKHLEALRGLGHVESERGNPQASLDYLNRALSLAVELNNRQGKAAVLHNLGESYKLLNRPQDALKNFQDSFEIMQQIGDKKGMASSLDQTAVVYASLGRSSDAEKTYRQELDLRKELGDRDGLSLALIDYGSLLQDVGRTEDALANTKQALQIALQVGNQARQATCLENIGVMYAQMAKYDDALMYQQRAVDLLQKLKLPSDLAGNLNNLALTYATIGQFDQALNIYLQALDQARKTGDKTMISAISDGMADLFAIEGRFGAALSAQNEAVRNAQQLEQQSGTFLAESQADLASILSRLGRGQEAQKILDDSLNAARAAKNDTLTAKVLNFEGESFYYRGDFKSARPLFEGAQQAAIKSKDRIQNLTARFNLARLAVKDGRAASVVGTLRALLKEADSLSVKYLSTKCSIALGDALLQTKDYSGAQDQLQSAVRKSEDSAMKSLLPEAHYLLSQVLRKKGNNADADRHLQQAAQLTEEMRKEANSDALLQRADLKPIVQAAK